MPLPFLRILSASLCAVFLATPSPAQTPAATPDPNKPKFKRVMPETPPGVTMLTKDIATYPKHTVTLTLYVPDQPGRYPTVLDVHGGGWKQRQMENDRPMMERIAARGFVTALVTYRLSTEAKYPAALNDCKAAVRYLRAHAAEFKVDADRIGVMGGSAGGHLSGLMGMTSGLKQFDGEGPNPEQSSAVQACIVMAATMDLIASNKDKTADSAVEFFGTTAQEKPELFVQASPITHVRAGVPPTIFIEGEKDTLKIGRAEMQEKLKALGIETAVHTLPGAPHPFWMSEPWLDQTVDIATAFFKKQLGEPKPANP